MERSLHRAFLVIAISLLIAAQIACGGQLQPTPTLPSATSTPTSTPEPADTPRPTNTPRPPATATLPPLVLGETETVEQGGFSFRPVVGFVVQINGAQALVATEDAGIMLSMAADTSPEAMSVEEMLDGFLQGVAEDVEDFQASDPSPIVIGEAAGLSVDVTGEVLGKRMGGRIAVVSLPNNRFFFAFGMAFLEGPSEDLWESGGAEVFDRVTGTVSFFEPELPSADASPCAVAEDATYGYTQENPIRVGGGAFGGSSRESAYLDTLRGPGGESISYERIGSMPFGDTILDAYTVTYAGLAAPITLYIDEYSFEELRAPVGFTCVSAFPSSAP